MPTRNLSETCSFEATATVIAFEAAATALIQEGTQEACSEVAHDAYALLTCLQWEIDRTKEPALWSRVDNLLGCIHQATEICEFWDIVPGTAARTARHSVRLIAEMLTKRSRQGRRPGRRGHRGRRGRRGPATQTPMANHYDATTTKHIRNGDYDAVVCEALILLWDMRVIATQIASASEGLVRNAGKSLLALIEPTFNIIAGGIPAPKDPTLNIIAGGILAPKEAAEEAHRIMCPVVKVFAGIMDALAVPGPAQAGAMTFAQA